MFYEINSIMVKSYYNYIHINYYKKIYNNKIK